MRGVNMKIRIVERDGFCVCGHAVETNAANNNRDISELYKDFFSGNREGPLMRLSGSKKGYYGLTWYTSGHERYCYLLGIEVSGDNTPPKDAVLREVPASVFAVASFDRGADIIGAWNEFFYKAIPEAGYSPNEGHGYYFEYYPEDVYGKYELWTPVLKLNE